jgi:hypothetical protein
VAEVDLPSADPTIPILIKAERGSRWMQGVYEVWLLQGNCEIRQGRHTARAQESVVWIERNEPTSHEPSRVIAYLEGQVVVDSNRQGAKAHLVDQTWLGRFQTAGSIDVDVAQAGPPPGDAPPIYQRAMAKRNPIQDNAVRRTEFQQPAAGAASSRFRPNGMSIRRPSGL